MKILSELLSQDRTYTFGERESGPDGAKKAFLKKGRAFLSALGRDLGFTVQKVYTNKVGIAVSGEVYLRGMWNDAGGLFVEISQPVYGSAVMHYGTIDAMDGRIGALSRVTLEELRAADYAGLLLRMLDTRTCDDDRKAA
jgi:hypothetical protein